MNNYKLDNFYTQLSASLSPSNCKAPQTVHNAKDSAFMADIFSYS